MTEEQRRAQAARERAAAVATRSDRPSERRCAEISTSRAFARAKAKVELRGAGGTGGLLHFTGAASAYEAPYEMWDYYGPYTEIVSAGAGAQSLAQADLDVPLVLDHESIRRIARTTNGSLTLSEGEFEMSDGTTGQGLICDAPQLDPGDFDVQYIEPKIRAELIDEMSFKFTITSGQWSPDYMEFRINSYNIHRGDVAIVGYGANPATTAQMRGAQRALAKLQASRALDPEDVNMLTQALGWFTSVDNIVDDAQAALADYLKVPNPDTDEAAQQLAALKPQQIRMLELGIRRELVRREMPPAMTLRDLDALL